MPPPFARLTLEEFGDLLQRYAFSRRIDGIHVHHTWRPDHAQFAGEASIDGMWRFHTQRCGWSDIAQHATIDPQGGIWTGRPWNRPPASASGYNGNAVVGPFMFEMVGDFDRGCDRLEGAQLAAVVGVIARLRERFQLGGDALRFHRSMTSRKSCPGDALDPAELQAAVEPALAELRTGTRPAARGWAGAESLRVRERTDAVLLAWQAGAARGLDPLEAELSETDVPEADAQAREELLGPTRAAPGAQLRGTRADELTPEQLAALRPHVVNLNQGRFSDDGRLATSPADVDAIFEDHLPRAAAAGGGAPLRVVFRAHGGLISESAGLAIAQLQVDWWKRNGVYPIHFVWETGLLDALRQLLFGVRSALRGRDFFDATSDLAIELAARALGAGKLWAAMKRSAELAAAPADDGAGEGGARYVARRLREFRDRQGAAGVELHAVGHSAGSIFHAHFLPVALDLGLRFKTLQLLAPAIRVDEFKRRLAAHVGAGIESLALFTMQRDWEERDQVAALYRKSLLYLIHFALEPERRAPILGLDASLRADAELRDLLGLRGRPVAHAEVIWSVTHASSGASASTSRSHGGFDNDRATMESVAQRVLGAAPAVPFPEEAVQRGAAFADAAPQWPPELAALLAAAPVAAAAAPLPAPPLAPAASANGVAGPGTPAAAGGRRRALCVGIDHYPRSPLLGCVADAREWARVLGGLGFEARLLLDEEATRARMLGELRALIADSTAGDVLVFQYAGHGTELPDLDGDEVDGGNGARDEALCPHDCEQGAFLIDDDLAELFAAVPDGVNATCFIDCCHSGTVTRLLVGPAGSAADGERRARFLWAGPELEAAHRRFREPLGAGRGRARRGAGPLRQVVFSACRDDEVAYEDGGHGEFTLRATRLLAGGAAGIAHEEFARRVIAAFGAAPRQHPELDCAPAARGAALLAALAAGAPVHASNGASAAASNGLAAADGRAGAGPVTAALAQTLRALAEALSSGR